MNKPEKLVKDNNKYIGVVAPSSPIVGDNIQELEIAKNKIEALGYRVKYSKNIYLNDWKTVANPKSRAYDINSFFKDKACQMIWCAKGGQDCSSLFEYLDFDIISKNPKIFCGFSDITSLNNLISSKCNLITFSGPNFKTIFEDAYNFSLDFAINTFSNTSFLSNSNLGFFDINVINPGIATGQILGGNLTLMTYLVTGKYKIDFKDKILFLEELGFESSLKDVNRNINFMIQNNVFDQIAGLVIGNYNNCEDDGEIEDIIINNLKLANKLKFPIIKTNVFGHIENMITFPIGALASIDTTTKEIFKLEENTILKDNT